MTTLSDDALRLAAEMRAGLDGVTSGPWFVSGVRFRMNGGEWHSINRYDETEKQDKNIACVGFDKRTGEGLRDTAHIARCHPSNIRLLLDAIDTLRRERDERADAVEAQAKCFAGQIAQAETTIAAQAAEIARKDAALGEISRLIPGLGYEGVGTIARAALQPTETPATVADQEPVAQRIEHAEPDEGRQDAGSTPAGFATPTLTQSGAGEPVAGAVAKVRKLREIARQVREALHEDNYAEAFKLLAEHRKVSGALLSALSPVEPAQETTR